jgi:heparosan-N-sulfate-glucuronate 5-epimerase
MPPAADTPKEPGVPSARGVGEAAAVMGQRVTTGLRAAFGVGVGYEPQPVGSNACFDGARVAGYFLDLRAKTRLDPKPHVSGRGVAHGISATNVAQGALGWWERSIDGELGAADRFIRGANALLARAERGAGSLLWRYEVAVPKYGRASGWYSAMAQGQAASVFVRAGELTGDVKWREAALGAVAPFFTDSVLGLVRYGAAGPALEECPSEPSSTILNGWVYALWGLWDVAVGISDDVAAEMFSRSSSALEVMLPQFDTGWWTRYSLYPAYEDLATPFYHRIHVAQIDVMARLSGACAFAAAAERWDGYVTPFSKARAIGTKTYHALRGTGVVEADRLDGR